MPISSELIEKHSKKQIIVLDDQHTLDDVAKTFQQKNSPENETYLIIQRRDKQFQVALISELKEVLAQMGMYQSLAKIPTSLIPPADDVIPIHTKENELKIINRLRRIPDARFIIIDGDKVVCVFTNPNRGLFDRAVSFLELHGMHVKLSELPDVDHHEMNIEIPRCPHCRNKDFYDATPDNLHLICRHCGKRVD